MTNLKNEKQNSQVLNELKYFAMAGYTIDSIDFNNDNIQLVRHTETTSHPISLVKYKNNKLHILSVSSVKPMNKITAMSNAVPIESVVNNESYDEYLKNLNTEAYRELQDVKAKLQNLDAVDFDAKSELLFSHFKAVSKDFKKRLQNHLESVRNVLINAEICDEDFLKTELKDLHTQKATTSIKTSDCEKSK